MQARVNSEMLICCSKTRDWAFYGAWAEEYKPWMIGTVGLTIQTVLPDFPITWGAAQNSREKLSLLSKKFSAAADHLVVQGLGVPGVKLLYSGGFVLCMDQEQASSFREQNGQSAGAHSQRKWKLTWSWSRGIPKGFLSKSWVIGDPDFQKKIFDNWLW